MKFLKLKVRIEKLFGRSFFNPYKVGSIYHTYETNADIKVTAVSKDGTVSYVFTRLMNTEVTNSDTYTCKWYGLFKSGYEEKL